MIAQTVKRLRVERGWTQAQLAERGGLTQGHVSMLEKGDRESIREETFARLAMAFRLSLDELKKEIESEGGVVELTGDVPLALETVLINDINRSLQGLSVESLQLLLSVTDKMRLAGGMRPVVGTSSNGAA